MRRAFYTLLIEQKKTWSGVWNCNFVGINKTYIAKYTSIHQRNPQFHIHDLWEGQIQFMSWKATANSPVKRVGTDKKWDFFSD